MKSFPLFTIALLTLLSLTRADASEWLTDLHKATTQARAERKAVLVNFSGSDWCGWCMKMRRDVFLKPAFTNYAASNLVLVEIDFPKRKPLPPEVQKVNQQLAQQFEVQGFPTLVLLGADGNRLGNVKYANGGPRTFIAEVEKLLRPPSDTPQPKPALRKPATPKRVTPATAAAAPTNRADLVLSRIVSTKKSRQAVINDTTLAAGQSATIKVGNGRVKILVVEVRERSAIISVEGQRQRRELRLASGT